MILNQWETVHIRRREKLSDMQYFLMNKKILTSAASFYHEKLLELEREHPAWKYLKDRCVTEESVRKNLIGYTGESEKRFELWNRLYVEIGYLSSVIFK